MYNLNKIEDAEMISIIEKKIRKMDKELKIISLSSDVLGHTCIECWSKKGMYFLVALSDLSQKMPAGMRIEVSINFEKQLLSIIFYRAIDGYTVSMCIRCSDDNFSFYL